MSMQVSATLVGRWKIGLADSPPDARPTILMLDFDNREPINLAFPPDKAVQIARAILAQYENPPPTTKSSESDQPRRSPRKRAGTKARSRSQD